MQPMTEALRLALRGPSLFAFLVLLTIPLARRRHSQLIIEGGAGAVAEGFSLYAVLILPFCAGALAHWLIAREMVSEERGRKPSLWGRWLGLYTVYFVLVSILGILFSNIAFRGASGNFPFIYGATFASALAIIITFPVIVRTILAAAGEEMPRLTGVIRSLHGETGPIIGWFAACTISIPLLMIVADTQLQTVDVQYAEYAIPAAFVGLTAFTTLLQVLLAAVAARRLVIPPPSEAEVFR
jgi:hypothetical protein